MAFDWSASLTGADTTRAGPKDWSATLTAAKPGEQPLAERWRAFRKEREPQGITGLPTRLVGAAVGMLTDPILELAGPPAPLTERIFGGEENLGTRAADVGIKLAPLIVGIGTGAGSAALMPVKGLVGDILVGTVSGAAGGATSGFVEQDDVPAQTLIGTILGGGMGAIIYKLSAPGRALAKQYVARPGAEQMPNIAELDAAVPHVSIDQREAAARARALVNERARKEARAAFRKFVPEGTARADVHPAIWRLARKEAAEAAVAVRNAVSLESEGSFIGGLFRRAVERLDIDESLNRLRHIQNVFITRLGVTLSRDRTAFKDVGGEFADKILRTEELKDALEGRLVNDVWRPMWRGVPKAEEELVDSVLHGEGGRLSTPGLAAASRWREIDDQMFKEQSELGLMEEVSATHPAAVASGESIVPLQYRSNHVPHYINRKALERLASNRSPERRAFIEKLVRDGEASNPAEAARMLDEVLAEPHAGSKLWIRSPAQHERELALQLPREKNAKAWMRRSIHDYSRRVAQAKVWGPNDELFFDMRRRLAAQGGDAERLEKLFRVYVGRPPRSTGTDFTQLGRQARALSMISLLGPRVGVLQLLQLTNTAGKLGIVRTLEAIVAGWRNPELRAAAEEAGALLPSEHLLTTTEPVGKLAEWWIKNITLMPRGDRAARIVSALAGGISAKRWAQEYWRLAQADAAAGSPSLARGGVSQALKYVGFRNRAERMQMLQRRFEETLGIPIQHVIETQGDLPIDTVLAAMRSASHKTQFGSTILDLPEGKHTAWGKFIYTLQTFIKQQTPFVGKMASDAAKYGDTGPIVRYLLLYPALYETARPLLDFLAGREFVDKSDWSTTEKISDAVGGAMWVGILGGMGDFINSMSSADPSKRLFQKVAGAPISQAVDLVGGAGAAVVGNWGPFNTAAFKMIPAPLRAILAHVDQ